MKNVTVIPRDTAAVGLFMITRPQAWHGTTASKFSSTHIGCNKAIETPTYEDFALCGRKVPIYWRKNEAVCISLYPCLGAHAVSSSHDNNAESLITPTFRQDMGMNQNFSKSLLAKFDYVYSAVQILLLLLTTNINVERIEIQLPAVIVDLYLMPRQSGALDSDGNK